MFSRYRADCFRTVSLGKAGSFHANELIGEPYGLAYEIVNQKLNKLPPRTIQELGAKRVRGFEPELTFSSELTEATNELINDDKVVQPLTTVEIEALKQSGVHSSVRALAPYPGHTVAHKSALQEIIQKQIEQHANFTLKTEYSKEKYKKRKEAKYALSLPSRIMQIDEPK